MELNNQYLLYKFEALSRGHRWICEGVLLNIFIYLINLKQPLLLLLLVLYLMLMFPNFTSQLMSKAAILQSGAYVTLCMRACSHYEMRENKRHLSYGFF